MSCSNRIDGAACTNEPVLLTRVTCTNVVHRWSAKHEMCRSCMDMIYQPGRVIKCECGEAIIYSEPIPLFKL